MGSIYNCYEASFVYTSTTKASILLASPQSFPNMASNKALLAFLFLPLALVFLSCLAEAQLKVGFYEETCPHVEDIVREEMTEILKEAPSLAGPLLRMHFHDCFVRVYIYTCY